VLITQGFDLEFGSGVFGGFDLQSRTGVWVVLRKLDLHHVGPADRMTMDPIAPRYNLITGDNGLGKSFLLEASWWALTRTWHETPAVPNQQTASIGYSFDGDQVPHSSNSVWNRKNQTWKRSTGRPPNPGLVLYARIDGSFSAWDPARNYRLYQRADGGTAHSPAAYQFGSSQVFEGMTRIVNEGGGQREQVVCAGLIDDWTRWQATNAPQFEILCELLKHIGPGEQPLVPGKPRRPTLDDVRDIPTIRMPYGQDIPLTYCPAGVRRMCKLAYLLAWTLSEHKVEATRIGQPLSRQIIVLIDEPETHLHPKWQRTVLPSLAKAVTSWNTEYQPAVQFLVATHSPLVLASMEPLFDTQQDALWKLDMAEGGKVQLKRDQWHPRGDVNRWLVSDVFELGSPTSSEVEVVLNDASDLLAQETPAYNEVKRVNDDLARLLPEMDPFFIRWNHYMKEVLANEGT
jgi:hypothetical protein